MVETKLRIEDLQLVLEVYEETKEDFWLAMAAKACLIDGIPLPAIVHRYLITLTGDVIDAKGNRGKAQTLMRRDRYLETMRELVYLTGTTPEDAAERITKAVTMEGEDDDDVRTEGTLMHWWNNRPERYKTPTSIDDLYHNSYEQAVDSLRPFLSDEVGDGLTKLKIKKELFEQE
jgi:hypothetical protein